MAITLNSGFKMPVVGLGVWRMDGKDIKSLLINAIKIGYRHFDCAADYKNEAELWNSDHGHVLEACKDSLKKLQLDYLDLYLIHFPVATRHTGVGETGSALGDDGVLDIDTTVSLETTWHAMEELVSLGLVRSIGISNYDIFTTRDCLVYAKVKPAVNQIETHPYFQRDSLVKFCQKHGICITAHTPLGGAAANTEWFGSVSCLVDPVLKGLMEKYKKTAAQVVLRWGIQRNTVVIPKTSKIERLEENFQVLYLYLVVERKWESIGVKMPVIGLGVWRMDGKDIRSLLINAIKIGYRHFDCAAEYKNEAEVGEALAEAFQTGLVKREDLFITTKAHHGHVLEACKDSLKKLQLDYLDLYLVHFPVATRHTGVGKSGSALGDDGVLDIDTTVSLETTWHAMEELVYLGLVRSIGISNFDIFTTRDCLAYAKVKPAVNQIETHPYFQRDSLVKFCQKHGICITAHTPLGGAAANTEWFGSVSCLVDPVLKGLMEKYKKTAAQVVLRWGIQRNTVVIPKTSKLERLEENFQVFDFELTKEDMDLIRSLDRNYRTNQPAKFWGIDLYA
ncbi:hypothetical protein RJ640_017147 [Escallonia rubra]|uniref:NADP-dependent oxidoreductase domain-containing protein n=1 Tax=Escallonia rubra TaxID=112253 RepID=A0AA88RFZ2_9ASTE|nr:hypothetical protein RJ640_017147 [Escallonia rubra]